MSDVAFASDPAEIGARLKSATEIDPARLPRLAKMAEDWADEIGARLGELATKPIEVTYQQCDVENAPDPSEAGSGTSMLATLLSNRFLRPSFVAVERRTVEALVAGFFGCEPSADLAASREPTLLDRQFLRLGLAKALDAAMRVFKPMAEVSLSIGDFVTAEELAETLGEEPERYALFRFEIVMGSYTAPLTIAIPLSFLAPHRRFLAGVPEGPKVDADEAWKKDIEASFARSEMRIEAVLCKKKIPLSQVARFRVGETVSLDVGLTSLIPLECEDRPMFKGQVGRARDSYVVRVEERIDPAQEFIDDILSD
ncbi:FliM/FliN family flagellar motor switch protein [Jiella marina]|uniref:FliM/FliN family flagellar motor switch protein n=1 Tax=Jiella sp. LLJ827 TaxID=2917712 RepID=UPI002101A599|nr:FliM/FliN family flagellar motor switch protein [Jiella sp. LLJ827]MCQ0986742.1 FliM/FliN family flagellar motor switch protein [Jiella sp. LLJ827]